MNTKFKLNSVQIEYLEDLLGQTEAFLRREPDHCLALEDAKALELALAGEFTPAFRDLLESSIEQMESHPLFRVNSRDQIEIMTSILKGIR